MTRENKLALVVGFGLILLVGILVSDHFSPARRSQAAQIARDSFGMNTPPPMDTSDLVTMPVRDRTRGASMRPAPGANDDRRRTGTATPAGHRIDRNPTPGPPARASMTPASPARTGLDRTSAPGGEVITMGGAGDVAPRLDADGRLPFVLREVRRGETLAGICDEAYRDRDLVAALAAYNGIDDPSLIRAGDRLRIPPHETLRALAGLPAAPSGHTVPAPTAEPVKAPSRTYTVRSGDTLSEIAMNELGTWKRYREIIELNRGSLDSAADLRVGMVLDLPAE